MPKMNRLGKNPEAGFLVYRFSPDSASLYFVSLRFLYLSELSLSDLAAQERRELGQLEQV
jgi:hypothetical protein